ncbi:hypothetical protein A7Q01_01220 [Eikenella sp. NML96-A-049]|nr:hypothetical protein A7P97_09065 [Eikenella sp. NML070372]OAM42286.1 hypothetical protein A7Q01_01220 [Eikenella sp. NML96-A-049]VDG99323.1 Uncharacterised protein [Helicobacter pametensis]
MPRHLLTLKTGYPQQLAGRKIKHNHSIKRRAAQFCDFGLHFRLALLQGAYFGGGGAGVGWLLLYPVIATQHFFVDIALTYALCQSCAANTPAAVFIMVCFILPLLSVLKGEKGIADDRIVTKNKIL